MAEKLLPRYPIYMPSKGRADRCQTARCLAKDGVPFQIVVEPQEYDLYAARFGKQSVLALPFSNLGSVIPARNWIKDHAIAAGYARHWQLDDNMTHFMRAYKNERLWCDAGVALAATEDFVDRYENVAIAGLNYAMFYVVGAGKQAPPPFYRNVHVYSCTLILNSIPYRWRGKYNEDTDICLQALAGGWCTILMNAFLVQKLTTMLVKGGNTAELYRGDGRLKMARSLERLWPGVVTTTRRFKRPQHLVKDAWGRFDTPLRLKPGVDLAKIKPNDYGLKLVALKPIQHEDIRRLAADAGAGNGRTSIFQQHTAEALSAFVSEWAQLENIDQKQARDLALKAIQYYGGNASTRGELRPLQDLEAAWYRSLESGSPDYSLYGHPYFLSDIWACWILYSRKYLLAIRSEKSLPTGSIVADIGEIAAAVDLGCGFGYTTAALKELFPKAAVFGTNLKDTCQWKLASLFGKRYGFGMVPGIENLRRKIDLVFASEYFEHIENAAEHLARIIRLLHPDCFLIANSFGAKSMGHFVNYKHGAASCSAAQMSRIFNTTLRDAGYASVKTNCWNNRPAYWKRQH